MSLLNESIEDVYRVFGKYPKPDDIGRCECCMTAEEAERLLAVDLRSLTGDDLRSYTSSVFYTVGELEDFKYLLPRIIELCVKDEVGYWSDLEIVFRKVSLAGWLVWPLDEQNALLDTLGAKFDSIMSDPEADISELDDWICALGQCVADITVYLEPLLNKVNQKKLVALADWNRGVFTEAKMTSPYWDYAPENHKRIIDWLKQPELDLLFAEHFGDTV